LEELHFDDPNLSSMGEPFTEEEVRNAINQMPTDKARDPDGFTRAFFKKGWEIIKGDVMRVIELFGDLQAENFHWLNCANIVLLPKKEGTEEVTDFKPINLIHAIARTISKMLALCLGPFMNDLVSNAQSAFIKTEAYMTTIYM
jgi:mannosylglycoprotein endo-beta-mannosidase